MPTQQGSDAFVAAAAAARRRLRPDVPGHRAAAARQDPALGVRLQPLGRAPAARAGPQPVGHRPHRRCLLGRLGGARRRRRRAARARQRRRRLDPHPGRGQRAGRPQADPRPARRRTGCCARCRSGSSPTACVTRTRARHRGVLPRGREGLPRAAPAADRRHHPPRSPAPAAGRGRHRRASALDATPEVAELTLKTAAAARGARPPRRAARAAGAATPSPTTSCSTGRCSRWPSSAPAAARTAAPGTRPGWTT